MDQKDNSLVGEYQQYLKRFESSYGALGAGEFAKRPGRLIKKLAFEEFSRLYLEFSEMSKTFAASFERGDTMNDVVVKMLRERSEELVLPAPI